MEQQFRAGDTYYILTDIDQLPERYGMGVNTVVKGSTGHDHIVKNGKFHAGSSPKSRLIVGYIVANEKCTLKHPEHDDIPIEKGIWEVRRQREVWNGQERVVVD